MQNITLVFFILLKMYELDILVVDFELEVLLLVDVYSYLYL